MPKLTIFTPAYNREHTLSRTYESLCRQNCKDFLWLIVDDGSIDGTTELVHQWEKQDNGFEIEYVLIGLTQLSARCGDGSCQTHEDLIAGFSAIEAEAELVQIRLKLRAAAVIGSQQERFQVADGFVQPMQIAGLIFFRVQRNAGQIPIASVAVAFDFCTRCNGFVYDLLKRAAGDVFNDLHPREQRSPVFRF